LAEKPKVKIKLKAFVADLRAGLDDQSLIEKHNLTEAMLPKVIEQLMAAGHVSEEDLVSRNMLDTTQKVADLFSFPFGSDGSD
jgi:predicted transcriptional regulator